MSSTTTHKSITHANHLKRRDLDLIDALVDLVDSQLAKIPRCGRQTKRDVIHCFSLYSTVLEIVQFNSIRVVHPVEERRLKNTHTCTATALDMLRTTGSAVVHVLVYLSIVILSTTVSSILLLLFYCWWIRRRTRRKLVQSGLPTVFWRPRLFVRYQPPSPSPSPTTTDDHDDDNNVTASARVSATEAHIHTIKDYKLTSSSITNILPRMQRLQGPYCMYGTVYGIDTAVVHIAHPIPAMHVLNHYQQQLQQQLVAKPKPQQQQQQKLWESTGVLKMPAYNHFFDFCGQGVFTADGMDWKQKRAAVLHALLMRNTNKNNHHHNKNNKMSNWEEHLIQLAQTKAKDLVQALAVHAQPRQEQQQQQQQQQRQKSRNIVSLLQQTTIGLIYEYITHTPLTDAVQVQDNNRKNEESEPSPASTNCAPTTSATDETTPTSTSSSTTTSLLPFYLQSIIRIRLIILAQARSIWFLLPRWVYRMFSSLARDEERTMGPIRQFARLAIQKAAPGSPIAHLQSLELYQQQHETSRDDPFSITNNLLYETITLLFAGQDTSAATLSWTLHLLSLHPEKQNKLAEEVCRVMKHTYCDDDDANDDGSSSNSKIHHLTKKDIARMPYLDAVLKESMRLYPVAPFVVRKITRPVTLPPETENAAITTPPTVLPEGALACIWIYGLHRNREFWHRPNDFLPERWLTNKNDGTIKIDKGLETPGAYMPFAQGPRNCLGQPLAHIILRCLLAHLICSYEFRDVDGCVRKEMQAGFTVLPQGGVPLVWTKRQRGEA